MFVPSNTSNHTWNSNDAIALRTFLETETGVRLLYHLSEAAPVLLDGGDQVEKTLVRSGQVKGFSEAVATLINLTVEPPQSAPPVKSAYPDLDNDSEWQDSITP